MCTFFWRFIESASFLCGMHYSLGMEEYSDKAFRLAEAAGVSVLVCAVVLFLYLLFAIMDGDGD